MTTRLISRWIAIAGATASVAVASGAPTNPSSDVPQSALRRELRRMVGYTIVASDSVAESIERNGTLFIRTTSGRAFRVDDLLLAPLDYSDVVVFARTFQGRDSNGQITLYKLLIDTEIVDASLMR